MSRIAISSTCLLDAYGMHAPQVTCLLKAAYDTGAGPSQGVEILNILYTDYVQYIYIYITINGMSISKDSMRET